MKDSWGIPLEVGDWVMVETPNDGTLFMKIERTSDKGTWWVTILPRYKGGKLTRNVRSLKIQRERTFKVHVDDSVENYLAIVDCFQNPPKITLALE